MNEAHSQSIANESSPPRIGPERPSIEEVALWRHVSVASAITAYARRNGLDVRAEAVREDIKAAFRAATPSEPAP